MHRHLDGGEVGYALLFTSAGFSLVEFVGSVMYRRQISKQVIAADLCWIKSVVNLTMLTGTCHI